jgi:hypothetical protein
MQKPSLRQADLLFRNFDYEEKTIPQPNNRSRSTRRSFFVPTVLLSSDEKPISHSKSYQDLSSLTIATDDLPSFSLLRLFHDALIHKLDADILKAYLTEITVSEEDFRIALAQNAPKAILEEMTKRINPTETALLSAMKHKAHDIAEMLLLKGAPITLEVLLSSFIYKAPEKIIKQGLEKCTPNELIFKKAIIHKASIEILNLIARSIEPSHSIVMEALSLGLPENTINSLVELAPLTKSILEKALKYRAKESTLHKILDKITPDYSSFEHAMIMGCPDSIAIRIINNIARQPSMLSMAKIYEASNEVLAAITQEE